jgi:hypothetical protein
MFRPMRRRLRRAVASSAVLAGAVTGAVLLSGSDQPVTAHDYPRWQEIASPPLSPRTHALAVHAGDRVLLLGGNRPGASPSPSGAAYDLRTGTWDRLRIPVPVTDRDSAVVVARVVVLRHLRSGHRASWWRYDVQHDTWSRLRDLPPRLSAPFGFGSEVYALSGRRVVVLSVQLGRWTRLPPDQLRPMLSPRNVTASRAGTVVTGSIPARSHRLVADRWDGLRWHRGRSAPAQPATAAPDGAARIHVGGRTLVVRGDRAWIRLP